MAVEVESPSLSVADDRDARIESTQVTSSCCSEEHCFSHDEDSTSVAPPSPFMGNENENMFEVVVTALGDLLRRRLVFDALSFGWT